MVVHGMRAGQQVAECRSSHGEGHGQPDRRPQRIAPAHPVPETESGGDAHLRSRRGIGGQRHEMPRHIFTARSEEHTSELQSQSNLVCRLLLEKKKKKKKWTITPVESAFDRKHVL